MLAEAYFFQRTRNATHRCISNACTAARNRHRQLWKIQYIAFKYGAPMRFDAIEAMSKLLRSMKNSMFSSMLVQSNNGITNDTPIC